MARISGAEPGRQRLVSGLFTRIAYAMTKRKVGRVVKPVQLMAHHTRLLWGYAQMEQSMISSHRVDGALKDLAQLRAAPGGLSFLNRHRFCRRQNKRHVAGEDTSAAELPNQRGVF